MTAQPVQHQTERLLEQLRTTAQLEDKTWFVSLPVRSLFSVGVLAMVAHVLPDSDGTHRGGSSTGIAPALTQQETEMQ